MSRSRVSFLDIISLALGLIFLVLFIVNFTRSVNNSDPVTFVGFLDYLSRSPQMLFQVNVQDFVITGSWGLLEPLKNFLNIFTSAFGIILYFLTNLLNMINYLTYFISYLFV